MELGLKGKVAVVAAASQGLGKAAAFSLAKEGVNLAICSRNEKQLKATAEEIVKATGVKVLPVVADLSNEKEIEKFIQVTIKEFGRIDILVNNAGGPPTGKITALSDSEWEKGYNLTLMSMVRLTRMVLPIMEKQQWGRVTTIVSITAKEPINDLLISSTIRPGILGLSKILSNQYAKFNITVNTICPGFVLTQRQEELSRSRSAEKNMTTEEYLAESAKSIPIGRLGKPEEIGDVIAFLSSQRASFITGTNILVDGGQTKGIA
ncbi:MAG: SDR family oxidoreductase [Bacteroidota bacterium]|nr:SDR family oxidoreductase [Bacteroidota bacterium]